MSKVQILINNYDIKTFDGYFHREYNVLGVKEEYGFLYRSSISIKTAEADGELTQLILTIYNSCKDDVIICIDNEKLHVSEAIASIRLIEGQAGGVVDWVHGLKVQLFVDAVVIQYNSPGCREGDSKVSLRETGQA